MAEDDSKQPGPGVDRYGNQVIDPSKNVADLVEAKAKSDAELRAAEQRFLDAQLASMNKFNDYARESGEKFNTFSRESAEKLDRVRDQVERGAEIKFQNYAREAEARIQINRTDAETRRIDQLAETRQEFQNTIRDMLAESVRTTSTLVSTQLVQIQATFDTRVSKLEAQAFTAAGRSSVADPAIESAMTRMSQGISGLSASSADAMNKMAASNAEAMTKLTATMASMQASAAAAAGERGGKTAATTAQIVAETLRVHGETAKHGSEGNIIAIGAIVVGILIAAATWFNRPAPTVVERPAPGHVMFI
jgi:hypothetical protein